MPHLAVVPPHGRALKTDDVKCQPHTAFKHGVASGDPYADSVVIWTRITPGISHSNPTLRLSYTVATDSALKHTVASGHMLTNADVDYTAKTIVSGLKPATKYYYQFSACAGSLKSLVGSTKTAPAADADVDVALATVSCSAFEKGYFHAYGRIADKADHLDAVLHLGDFIYEYGNSKGSVRQTAPNYEVLSLSDYRTRYALYMIDDNLQRLRQLLPWIVIPDDHEVANDGWRDGAENHQPATEGDWHKRVDTALRAYFEWQPLRPVNNHKEPRFYRSFAYGKRVHLSMLDTRYESRDQQLAYPASAADVPAWRAAAATKKIMSDTQMQWLVNNIHTASQQWKVIGNQVMLVDLVDWDNEAKFRTDFLWPDMWLGYKLSQKQLLDGIGATTNVIVHTGDFHDNFAMEGFAEQNPSGKPYLVEFVGTSVTSGGYGEYYRSLGVDIASVEQDLIDHNRWMYDVNFDCKGYFIATYKKEEMLSDFYCVHSIKDPNDKGERVQWNLKVCSDANTVQQAYEPCA